MNYRKLYQQLNTAEQKTRAIVAPLFILALMGMDSPEQRQQGVVTAKRGKRLCQLMRRCEDKIAVQELLGD